MNQTFLEGGKDPRSQLSLVLNTVTVARDLKINWVKKIKNEADISVWSQIHDKMLQPPTPGNRAERACSDTRGEADPGTEAAPWLRGVHTPLRVWCLTSLFCACWDFCTVIFTASTRTAWLPGPWVWGLDGAPGCLEAGVPFLGSFLACLWGLGVGNKS